VNSGCLVPQTYPCPMSVFSRFWLRQDRHARVATVDCSQQSDTHSSTSQSGFAATERSQAAGAVSGRVLADPPHGGVMASPRATARARPRGILS
jgi:hypothetical protein